MALRSPPRAVGRTVPRTRESLAIEQFALGFAWHDAKKAGLLACELIRWAMPVPDNELSTKLARKTVLEALAYVEAWTQSAPLPQVPHNWEPDKTDYQTRVYWYLAQLSNDIGIATSYLTCETSRNWYATGQASRRALEFVRKTVSGNTTMTLIDGAAGAILHNMAQALSVLHTNEEITSRMFYWRVQDALQGRVLPPEVVDGLQPAFSAAWSAGEYEFAYSLLDTVDVLAEPVVDGKST